MKKQTTLTSIFAVNLKSIRLLRKLSQEALAQKAGISVSYVSMLEREVRSPPLQTIELVAAALKVSAVELLQEAA
jgi:transcriptional regulator with XRE-family HTH domain